MDEILLNYMCRDLVNIIVEYAKEDLPILKIEARNIMIKWNRFCEDFQKSQYYNEISNPQYDSNNNYRMASCIDRIRYKYLDSIQNYKNILMLENEPNKEEYNMFKKIIYDSEAFFKREKQLRNKIKFCEELHNTLLSISQEYYHFRQDNNLYYGKYEPRIRDAQEEWLRYIIRDEYFHLQNRLGCKNRHLQYQYNDEIRPLNKDMTTSKYYNENGKSLIRIHGDPTNNDMIKLRSLLGEALINSEIRFVN